ESISVNTEITDIDVEAPNSKLQASEKLQTPNCNNSKFLWEFGAWIPLTLLLVTPLMLRDRLPVWVFMWLLALAIFVGCKRLTWRRARQSGAKATAGRALGYLFAWPGMDAANFLELKQDKRSVPGLRDG